MFKRLELETWMDFVPFVAFFLTFIVFLVFCIRALRLRREEVDHMAALPLDTNGDKAPQHFEIP